MTLDASGKGAYHARPKLDDAVKWSLTHAGVNVGSSARSTSRLMLLLWYVAVAVSVAR